MYNRTLIAEPHLIWRPTQHTDQCNNASAGCYKNRVIGMFDHFISPCFLELNSLSEWICLSFDFHLIDTEDPVNCSDVDEEFSRTRAVQDVHRRQCESVIPRAL